MTSIVTHNTSKATAERKYKLCIEKSVSEDGSPSQYSRETKEVIEFLTLNVPSFAAMEFNKYFLPLMEQINVELTTNDISQLDKRTKLLLDTPTPKLFIRPPDSNPSTKLSASSVSEIPRLAMVAREGDDKKHEGESLITGIMAIQTKRLFTQPANQVVQRRTTDDQATFETAYRLFRGILEDIYNCKSTYIHSSEFIDPLKDELTKTEASIIANDRTLPNSIQAIQVLTGNIQVVERKLEVIQIQISHAERRLKSINEDSVVNEDPNNIRPLLKEYEKAILFSMAGYESDLGTAVSNLVKQKEATEKQVVLRKSLPFDPSAGVLNRRKSNRRKSNRRKSNRRKSNRRE